MRDSDYSACMEFLSELILKEGKTAYCLLWDSGGPGAGAGCELVVKFRDFYWQYSDTDGLSGPFDELEYALSDEHTTVTSATRSISSTELSSGEIVEYLEPFDLEHTKRIVINGEAWVITLEGHFMKKAEYLRRSGKLVRLYDGHER